MGTAMEVTNEALEVIGRYVRDNLGNWIRDAAVYPAAPPPFDPELRERAVRVEEELKAQRELMKIGFDHVDKRFEEMRADTKARFEQVDKRFEQMRTDMNTRFEQVDKRFEQVDKRFEDMRSDMNTRFDQVDRRFEEMRSDMNTRFAEQRADTNRRFDEMHKSGTRWMVFVSVVMSMMTLFIAYGTFFR